MRALSIVCGISVLIMTLHFTHFLHHFFAHSPAQSVVGWAGGAGAIVVSIFSFIGGCLLLRRGR